VLTAAKSGYRRAMEPSFPAGPAAPAPAGFGQPNAPYPYGYQSGAPRTLGTLSIVFGAVTIFSNLLALVFTGGMAGLMRALPGQGGAAAAAMEHYQDAIRLPSLIHVAVFVPMSVWLIGIGVGQRRYRGWAVRQSVRWGVLALVIVVGDLVMNTVVMLPAAQRMSEEIYARGGIADPFGGGGSIVGLVFQVAIHAAYPIILLVAFRKPSVARAMTS
jgi:hypothetical protein